jgi:hypothetical protein
MARIGFVACCKTKGLRAMPAAALYRSALFRKSLLAALDACDKVYILSAKHGVIPCNEIIEPYDVTLKTMRRSDREAWGLRVKPQLASLLRARDVAVMYCGEEYLAPLRAPLEVMKVSIEVPLGSLSLGARLKELVQLNDESTLRLMNSDFLNLLRKLWGAQRGGRRFDETSGRLPWPSRGVYFICEQSSGLSGGRMPRVVRVGTHAVSQGSRTSLWDRLSTHRGTNGGGGSHRSSIFRLHVGRAWARHMPSSEWPATWAQGQSAPRSVRDTEKALEWEVSRIIGTMRVLWLDVPDEPGPNSERAYLERNAIALLSRVGLLDATGSPDWLGRSSGDWRIAASGLWNLNHVFAKPDAKLIERLSRAVADTVGQAAVHEPSQTAEAPEQQMDFFKGEVNGGGDARGADDQGNSASDRSSAGAAPS